MDLREKFDAALDFITQSRKHLLEANEAEIEAREILKGKELLAKEALKSREDELLAMPKGQTPIDGPNAEARAAQLRELTKELRDALAVAEREHREGVAKAEKEKRLAVYRLELALDARRNLESILKIEELEKI
jgi:hypothetical protein